MNQAEQKPIIGFTSGDLNGIGLEVTIKALNDTRITDLCIPVIFASNKSVTFTKRCCPKVISAINQLKILNG